MIRVINSVHSKPRRRSDAKEAQRQEIIWFDFSNCALLDSP